MSKIRVLQLISGIAVGRQSGGAEAHALQLARLLDRRQFHPAVFSMWRYGGEVEAEWEEKIAAWELPLYGLVPWTGNLWRGMPSLWPALRRAVAEFRPHIISTHSERGDWFNSLTHLFHRQHPLAVRSVHIDRPWQTHPLIGKFLEKTLFSRTFAAEIAISQTIWEQLREQRGEEARLRLIYNGVDESIFGDRKVPPAMPDDLPGDRPIIGIVGRLTPQKGVGDLLEAVALVNQEQPLTLLIIGDGPLRGHLAETAVALGLGDKAHFLGVRHDVLAILANLDLFALPSYWEGFPTVILEAMSQNTPVIATDVSGSRELVRDGVTGHLIPPGSPRRLAAAIRAVLAEPARARRMAAQARVFAAQFTYQNMTRQYEMVYAEIVEEMKKQSG